MYKGRNSSSPYERPSMKERDSGSKFIVAKNPFRHTTRSSVSPPPPPPPATHSSTGSGGTSTSSSDRNASNNNGRKPSPPQPPPPPPSSSSSSSTSSSSKPPPPPPLSSSNTSSPKPNRPPPPPIDTNNSSSKATVLATKITERPPPPPPSSNSSSPQPNKERVGSDSSGHKDRYESSRREDSSDYHRHRSSSPPKRQSSSSRSHDNDSPIRSPQKRSTSPNRFNKYSNNNGSHYRDKHYHSDHSRSRSPSINYYNSHTSEKNKESSTNKTTLLPISPKEERKMPDIQENQKGSPSIASVPQPPPPPPSSSNGEQVPLPPPPLTKTSPERTTNLQKIQIPPPPIESPHKKEYGRISTKVTPPPPPPLTSAADVNQKSNFNNKQEKTTDRKKPQHEEDQVSSINIKQSSEKPAERPKEGEKRKLDLIEVDNVSPKIPKIVDNRSTTNIEVAVPAEKKELSDKSASPEQSIITSTTMNISEKLKPASTTEARPQPHSRVLRISIENRNPIVNNELEGYGIFKFFPNGRFLLIAKLIEFIWKISHESEERRRKRLFDRIFKYRRCNTVLRERKYSFHRRRIHYS